MGETQDQWQEHNFNQSSIHMWLVFYHWGNWCPILMLSPHNRAQRGRNQCLHHPEKVPPAQCVVKPGYKSGNNTFKTVNVPNTQALLACLSFCGCSTFTQVHQLFSWVWPATLGRKVASNFLFVTSINQNELLHQHCASSCWKGLSHHHVVIPFEQLCPPFFGKSAKNSAEFRNYFDSVH